jgi:hypothetical protein
LLQEAGSQERRAGITAEAGSALYLAELFGSNDAEAMVRLITAIARLGARSARGAADAGQ